MNIGDKLKNARARAGLTQEFVADNLGVSRQTISNWENGRSYPDIISILGLSDLYSISLDEMLKGDVGMIKYLEENTDNAKSRRKFSKLLQIITYVVIWAISIIIFWIGGRSDAMGYSLMVFFLVLPVTTFIVSLLIGIGDGWTNYKWFMSLFFGAMYMLAVYGTFGLANAAAFNKTNLPNLIDMFPGMVISVVGLSIGVIVKLAKSTKSQ